MGLNRKKKDFRAAVDLTNTFGERCSGFSLRQRRLVRSLGEKRWRPYSWRPRSGRLTDVNNWRSNQRQPLVEIDDDDATSTTFLLLLQATVNSGWRNQAKRVSRQWLSVALFFSFSFLRWTIGSFVKNKSLFFFFFCHPIRQRWGVTNSHIADRSAIALHPWYYFQEPLMEKNDWFTVSFRINGHRTSAQKMIYLFFSLSINKI